MILLNDYTLITQGIEGGQYAIFPLIPILIGIAVGAAAIGLFAFIGSEESEPIKGNKIAVLGMQGAGKTTFYNMLRDGKPGNPTPSGTEETQKFDFKLNDSRTITILKGVDISGEPSFVRQFYEEMIIENDCIIFIFDINKYMNDFGTYRRETNARFAYLYRHLNGKEFVIIGSHLDKINEERQKNVYNDFISLMSEKEYNELFKKNCFFMNICSIEAINKMMNKLFDKNVVS